MLGEMLGGGTGKVTGRRVTGVEPLELEVSFRQDGSMFGTSGVEIGTYTARVRGGGLLYGEGQGMFVTADGESATWRGAGFGRFKAAGGVAWRGAVYYETSSPKLSRLHGVVAVFEYETDAEDNTRSTVWEWK